MRLALLIVDVQERAIALAPYDGDAVVARIGELLAACRAHAVDVIHVQHAEPDGQEGAAGTPGWEIHAPVAPAEGETIIGKRHNSAFRGTNLKKHLEALAITDLMVVGIQTEYCVDTTCRVAFEHGFRVIVPEGTNTTYDNGPIPAEAIISLVNDRILADRFARLVSMPDALDAIRAP